MLTESLLEALNKEGVALDEFRELCLRLLNYGVLCRSENQIEQQLYDRFIRIEDTVIEYLQIIGIRILHERRFAYLRVYPPGSQIPGIDDDGEDAFGGGLRARLRQDEVALILVLRLQYDKALREGQLDDLGFVSESVESLSIALKNILGRSLPDKVTDRKRMFQRLKQLRLIEYRQDENMESVETWLKINPMILTFVTEASLIELGESLDDEVALEDTDLDSDDNDGSDVDGSDIEKETNHVS